jgi:hypothetical protein
LFGQKYPVEAASAARYLKTYSLITGVGFTAFVVLMLLPSILKDYL